ncbi:MAG: hypothetical protein ACXWFX_08680 [Methylobacter sp.]
MVAAFLPALFISTRAKHYMIYHKNRSSKTFFDFLLLFAGVLALSAGNVSNNLQAPKAGALSDACVPFLSSWISNL